MVQELTNIVINYVSLLYVIKLKIFNRSLSMDLKLYGKYKDPDRKKKTCNTWTDTKTTRT